MKYIELTNGYKTKVDDEDFDRLSEFRWCGIRKSTRRKTKVYVCRSAPNKETKHMHREIMNCPEGMVVDHTNDDTLDNRKENLRICTHRENIRNQNRVNIGVSGFKGVHKSSSKGKWTAKVNYTDEDGNYHTVRAGVFLTPEEAAKAYDDLARKYHGEYANLNNI